MRTGRGGKVAVAAASGLLATCLAGGPLYISSTASEALQVGLSQSCLTDAGLRFGMAPLHDPDTGTITDQPEQVELDRLGALIPNTQPPIVTDETADVRFAAVGDANPASKRVILLSRVGQLANLDVDIGANDLSANTALVPEWDIPAFGADTTKRFEITIEPPPAFEPDGSGGSVTPATGEPRIVALDIVGSYPDIPTRPEPSFWCGQRDLFRLTRLGDRPTPVAFVSEQTIAALQPTRTWELRPDPNGLTRHDAREMIADFEQLRAAFIDFLGVSPEQAVQFGLFESRLPDLVRRADLQTEIVARTIAPIRLSGIGAAALMLIASGVLIARERRRDLRLRVMRGVSPGRVGASVVAGELAPVVIGSALGALVAFAAVRALGPTAELEPGPTRTAIVSVAAGALAATSLVEVITAIVTASTIDGRTRRRHRSIPWEFVLVPLAVVSYLRLDRVGGVKLVGAEAKGGDLLAQAFPILAITAPLAIAGGRWQHCSAGRGGSDAISGRPP